MVTGIAATSGTASLGKVGGSRRNGMVREIERGVRGERERGERGEREGEGETEGAGGKGEAEGAMKSKRKDTTKVIYFVDANLGR